MKPLVSGFLLLVCGHIGFTAGYVGLLGTVVPWPQQPPIVMHEISLSSSPPGELRLSVSGEHFFYGEIVLGNGQDPVFTLVADFSGDTPCVWLDEDNDENPFNDHGGKPDVKIARNLFKWYFKCQVSYRGEGQTEYVEPYYVDVVARKVAGESGRWRLSYATAGLREGLAKLDDGVYKIYLGDRNSDGLYSDIENLTVLIDVDRDGQIAWYNEVYEIFEPNRIQVGSSVYKITRVDPQGTTVEMEKIGEAPPPPTLTPGNPLPLFKGATVTDEPIDLATMKGRVIVLLYLPLEACARADELGTDPCERARRVYELLEQYIKEEKVLLLGFSYETSATAEEVEALDLGFPVVVDEGLQELYRWSTLLIADSQGIIRATDYYRVYTLGRRITDIQYKTLEPFEILFEVLSLIPG